MYDETLSLEHRLLSSQAIYFVALLGLCAAYLQGGINKALNFAAWHDVKKERGRGYLSRKSGPR